MGGDVHRPFLRTWCCPWRIGGLHRKSGLTNQLRPNGPVGLQTHRSLRPTASRNRGGVVDHVFGFGERILCGSRSHRRKKARPIEARPSRIAFLMERAGEDSRVFSSSVSCTDRGRCRSFFRLGRERIAPSSARRATMSSLREGSTSLNQDGLVPVGWDPTDRVPNRSRRSRSFLSSVPAEEIQAYPVPSGGVRYPRRASLPSPPIPPSLPLHYLPNRPRAFEDRVPQSAPRAGISSPSLPPSRSLSPSSSCGRRERQREEREEKWREARLGSISTANNVERGGAAAALLLRATSTRHQTSSWRSRRAYASSAPSTSARNLDPRKEPRKEAPNQAACSAHCVGRRVERNVAPNVAPNVALNVEPSRKHRREETTNVHCGFPTPKHPNGWMDPSQVIVDSIQQVSPSQPSTCSSTWTRSIRTR